MYLIIAISCDDEIIPFITENGIIVLTGINNIISGIARDTVMTGASLKPAWKVLHSKKEQSLAEVYEVWRGVPFGMKMVVSTPKAAPWRATPCA